MPIEMKKSSWRHLWAYATYEDEDGLRPQDAENGELENEDGAPDDDLNGEFDQEGEFDSEVEFDSENDSKVEFEITDPEPTTQIPGFEILRSDVETTYLREFHSWHDFVTSAADQSLAKWNPSNRVSQQQGSKNWTSTESFSEAIEMAFRRGWPKGRELLHETLISIHSRPKVYNSLEFEVAGAIPCVPVYCTGDPAWMISDPGMSIRSAKPIVRIDYNNWVSAYVDVKSMMLRGAAIVSLTDSLERQGLSVELRIIGNSKSFYGRKVFRYSITYKRAGETLDLDRAAFAIAHPSSMRRLAFAILEQHKDLEPEFKGNYGHPMHQQNPALSTQNLDALTILFVPGSKGGETPDLAQTAVQKAATELLDQWLL
jgi:hypothetical protein